MMLIQKHPVLIIAKANGLATAAGGQLVTTCDIALVSEKSHFVIPGVNVGFFCSISAAALGRAVAKKVLRNAIYWGAHHSPGSNASWAVQQGGSRREVGGGDHENSPKDLYIKPVCCGNGEGYFLQAADPGPEECLLSHLPSHDGQFGHLIWAGGNHSLYPEAQACMVTLVGTNHWRYPEEMKPVQESPNFLK